MAQVEVRRPGGTPVREESSKRRVDVRLAEKLLLSRQFDACLCICYSLLYELSVSALPLPTHASEVKYSPDRNPGTLRRLKKQKTKQQKTEY